MVAVVVEIVAQEITSKLRRLRGSHNAIVLYHHTTETVLKFVNVCHYRFSFSATFHPHSYPELLVIVKLVPH